MQKAWTPPIRWVFLGATLLVRSFIQLRQVDPGFPAEHRLTLSYMAPIRRYPDVAALARSLVSGGAVEVATDAPAYAEEIVASFATVPVVETPIHVAIPVLAREPGWLAVDKPAGVAVDATHIYWANSGAGTIWKAPLAGGGATFLANASSSPQFAAPGGVAVDAAHVYWANTGALNLSGTYSFDRLFTSRAGVGGHEFASLLLGLPVDGSVPYNLGEGEWFTRYFGGYVQVGRALYRDFVLPFEITSLLLLAAIVGAVVMAKRRLS